MQLEDELATVESDLAAAQIEHARIGARIEGLAAQRDALVAAIHHSAPAGVVSCGADIEWSRLTKDRAIVEVLRRTPDPMRIADIVRALASVGRVKETSNGVSVYLDGLLKQERVERVSRGLYRATD